MTVFRDLAHHITYLLTGRRSAWLVLLGVAALSAGIVAAGGEPRISDAPADRLPASTESVRVAELQRQLPSGQLNPALVVYSREAAPLTAEDQQTMSAHAAALAEVAAAGEVEPPILAPDRQAAIVAVPLRADAPLEELAAAVDRIRTITDEQLPRGLTAEVSGGPGFSADIANSFEGADFTLLAVTVAVVAALLLVTYRSPWLWLVPLAVVGTADIVTGSLLALASRTFDLTIDQATIGIVDVLVFGAGTDYALLLIARYREELRRMPDRREALRRAVTSAGPAILASALTVCLSLLTLLAAVLTSDRALGVAGAIGLAVAALYGLIALPAALAVCGRGLFWPFVPRPEHHGGRALTNGIWSRLGRLVDRRPRVVAAGAVILLGGLALGLTDANLGLSRTEQFRVQAESIDGLRTVGRHFPAGAADPTVIIANATAEQPVLAAARTVPGVADAVATERDQRLVAINVVLTAEPDTPASYETIRQLRQAVHAVPAAGALVGGTVATNLDGRDAALQGLRVVVPLVLAVVLLVLIVLLRSLVAPVMLVLTVVATYFAAMGAGNLLFTQVLGYPALDTPVPLLAFLFLVALGVDYNIFLATRAREEAHRTGSRTGMLTALAVTGGVITSAGILLAAVFAVLGVLPLVTLTELGIIVGLGVLLDTLLVRTLLVPAIAILLGPRFWWPSALSRSRHRSQPTTPTRPEPVIVGHPRLVDGVEARR